MLKCTSFSQWYGYFRKHFLLVSTEDQAEIIFCGIRQHLKHGNNRIFLQSRDWELESLSFSPSAS